MEVRSIESRSASVLIVEASSGIRPSMTEAMRELGFSNLRSVDSLAEALTILAAEPLDWIITSFFPEEKVNALHILELAKNESLRKLKVSLFAAESERTFLTKAFELGLFTSHEKPFNKDSFKSNIADVLKSLGGNGWNSTLTSAEYLRALLKASNRYSALLQFELALSQSFPKLIVPLLHLAEAHFLNGNSPSARALLWQIEQRQPNFAARVAEMSQRYLGKDVEQTGAESWKQITLGTCVVLEPDTLVQNSLKEALTTCGASEIQVFDNGETCWQWLKANKEPELLVTEWRVPGLKCPLLLQRCRSMGFQMMPVIVHSSLVQKQDEPLLREMGISEVSRKPFRRDDILNCVAATVGQSQRPTEIRALEHKIRSLLACGKIAEATSYMQLYLKKQSPGSDATKLHLEAEFAFAAGDHDSTRRLAISSMTLGNKSVSLLNLLGKTLIQLRDFPAALKIFQTANDLTPNSVARICAIAETQLELGDNAAAVTTLKTARDLDAENQDVINSSVKIALVTGDKELVEENIDRFRGSESLLAYINNKAIAHAKAGDLDAGIALYKNALETIPKAMQRIRVMIGYNLALALARKGDSGAVIEVLKACPEMDDVALSRKMSSLLDRATESIASGKPIQLFLDGSGASLSAFPSDEIASRLVQKFDFLSRKKVETAYCCHGLYKDEQPDSDLIVALMSNSPRFRTHYEIKPHVVDETS